jgi:hypothetical protein
MAARKEPTLTINVLDIQQGRVTLNLLGQSPLIFNAMSEKTRQVLILPPGKKTAADKAASLKHEPLIEFQNSLYMTRNEDAPTALYLPGVSFKRAAMGAALDLPGASKTQIGRLAYVVGSEVPVFGIPRVFLSVVRSADAKRTPDIRTRAILTDWCATVTVEFVEPALNATTIAKLFAAAGITQGVGDWRVEKGSGDYGRFRVVSNDDPEMRMIVEAGAREAQMEAIANPETHDIETERLLSWFYEEIERRGKTPAPKKGKKAEEAAE